ncbi:hypothetical protein ACFVQB_30055 [Paenibacillus sp. NPDC057886]
MVSSWEAFDRPVQEGLVVDFGADDGHLVVMRVADFLLGGVNPVAQLNEE